MANRKLDKKLAKAARSYEKDDRRAGSRLVNEILQQDFHHQGTWKLLHRIYGNGRSFEKFQIAFAGKYYPDKSHSLERESPTASDDVSAPQQKRSLLSRFLKIFRRKPTADDSRAVETPAVETPAETDAEEASPSKGQRSISRVALNPLRKEGPKEPISRPIPAAALPTKPAAPKPSSTIARPSIQRPSAPAIGSSNGAREEGVIRVMVVDDIDVTRENVIRALRFEENIEVIDMAADGTEAIEMARELDPDVILMDVNMPDMDGITATSYIKRELPATQVIILTVQDDTDYIRQAMVAGARDFLTKPPRIDDLVTAVENAYKYTCLEREKAASIVTTEGQTSPIPGTGSIISVYSPRGGAGCSLIATNLAACLYEEDTPVVLVDGDFQFGDIPVLFNTQCKFTLLELAKRADELDPRLVDEVLVEHESGIRILAPPGPQDAGQISGEQFSQVLTFLCRYYPYVIVDTSHRLLDSTLAAFDISDVVILITTQDIPSIARIRRFLDLANLLHIDPQRFLTVMNRYDPKVNIHPKKVSEAFNHEISNTIPYDIATVIPSVNRGFPFFLNMEKRKRPIYAAMSELAEEVRERIKQLEEVKEEAVLEG